MARVTIEDCLRQVKSKFSLVLLASQRAKQLAAGSEAKIETKNDKRHVLALREIAENSLDIDKLQEQLIENNRDILKSSNIAPIDLESKEQSLAAEEILINDDMDKDDSADSKSDDDLGPSIG